MENQYLDEAWNNRPGHKVYGFRLRPFCLNYLHLLQSVKSPLLSAKTPFSREQLLMAAEICSSPWSEEGYTLDRIFMPSQFRLRRNQIRLMTENFQKQVGAWIEYYTDFLVVAKKWEDTGEEYDQWGHLVGVKKNMGRRDLDRAMATGAVLASNSSWSEKKIMMMPIGRAFGWADYFAIHQGDTKIKFVTAIEEAIQERDRKRSEEAERKAKEGEANGPVAN